MSAPLHNLSVYDRWPDLRCDPSPHTRPSHFRGDVVVPFRGFIPDGIQMLIVHVDNFLRKRRCNVKYGSDRLRFFRVELLHIDSARFTESAESAHLAVFGFEFVRDERLLWHRIERREKINQTLLPTPPARGTRHHSAPFYKLPVVIQIVAVSRSAHFLISPSFSASVLVERELCDSGPHRRCGLTRREFSSLLPSESVGLSVRYFDPTGPLPPRLLL